MVSSSCSDKNCDPGVVSWLWKTSGPWRNEDQETRRNVLWSKGELKCRRKNSSEELEDTVWSSTTYPAISSIYVLYTVIYMYYVYYTTCKQQGKK